MADDIEKRDDFEDDTQHKPQPINFDDIPDIINDSINGNRA